MYKQENNGIYKIENVVTGDFYIGSSVNIRKRFDGHRTLLRNNKHFSAYLQNAWNKYGEDNFKFYVLEYLDCELKTLRRLEQEYLDKHLPVYNMSKKVEYFGLRKRNQLHQENLTRALRNSTVKNSKEYRDQIADRIRNLWKDPKYRNSQLQSRVSKNSYSKHSQGMKKNLESGKYENRKHGIRSADDVLEIRKLYETGNHTFRELGYMFTVSRSTIARVVRRESWKYVE